jgi:hypothetical protein
LQKKVVSIAFCGVVSALCLVVLMLSGLIRIATIALPALAGIFFIPIVIEVGIKWAVCAYAAVSALSFFVVTDREAMLIFVLFFGYYPILKAPLDRIRSKLARWLVKLAVFNGAAIGEYFLAVKILMIPQEEYQIGGFSILGILLLLANLVFILYDILLERLIVLYCNRFRGNLLPFLKRK